MKLINLHGWVNSVVSLLFVVAASVTLTLQQYTTPSQISERLSSNVLLDDDLHSMLNQGRLVEVYEALRQQ